MNSNDIIALGLGLASPWQIVGQILDTDKQPHELRLSLKAKRGAEYPCPKCGRMCKAHDYKEMTWRHLNFFQHHCYITAPVPAGSLPRAWRQTYQGALGQKRKQVYPPFRAGSLGSGQGHACAGCCSFSGDR